MPKNEAKYPSKDICKQLFMESDCWTWVEFAKLNGWNYASTKHLYPTRIWIQEKVRLREQDFRDELPGIEGERAHNWINETNKTIKEYPEAIDRAKAVIDYRIRQYTLQAKLHQEGKPNKFEKISDYSLNSLAESISKLQLAKYRSLMLTELKIKEIEPEGTGQKRIVYELIGGSNPDEIRKVMAEWNNK